MGSKRISRSALAVVLLLTSISFAQSASQLRIVRPVDNRSVVRLQGSLVPRARAQFDRGAVAGDMPMPRMTLVFSRTAAQQSALDQLVAAQQDRSSPNYHKWLTPEEFGDRFGLSQPDVNAIAAWLISQGFTVDETSRSRTWIAFSGIAAQFEAAFRSSIHNYVVDGTTHYAPSAEPSIPEALAGVVAAISGTHDFRPQPKSRVRRVDPRLTSSLSGSHFLVPGDFGTIYNLPDYVNGVFQPGNDGTGQSIAVVGQTQLVGSPNGPFTDIDTFRRLSNLPPTHLQTILVGTDPGLATGDIEEANLDIQWSGAVAPNANIIFVYSKDALLTSLQNIVSNNLAPVISISYGECEINAPQTDITSVEGYLQQASAQGETAVAAAGDVGATDCDGTSQAPVATATHGLAVDYPASSQYVTAMGGSEFIGDSTAVPVNGTAPAQTYWNASSDPNDTSASAFAYIPEAVWNDRLSTGTNAGTGGGVSALFGKPSWQVGTGVPQDGHRDVPDLALASSPSHDGFIICSQGSCQTGYRRNSDQTFTVIGGTSAAVPSFAGIAALANQKLGARQGNLNSQIYSLAASSQWAFNDITNGDNKTVCTVGTAGCTSSPIGYSATAGYDLATGWGSVDASGFLNALAGQPAQPAFTLLPAQRNFANGSGTVDSESFTVASRQGFSGTVSLSCASGNLPGISCNPDSVAVIPGTPATTTLNVVVTPGNNFGAQSGTVTVTGTSGSITNSVAVPLVATYQDFTLVTGNPLTFPGPASQMESVIVQSVNAFSQPVDVACTSDNPQVTCSPSSASATPGPNQSAPVGFTVTNASATNISANLTFQATSSPLTHSAQLPVTVTVPDFTLTADGILTVPSGQVVTSTLSIVPIGGFSSDVALSCVVSPSLGTTKCTVSPPTVTGGTGTAVITVTGAVLSRDHGAPLPFQHRGLGTYATLVFSLGMVFAAKPNRIRRSVRAWRNILLGLPLLCVMFGALSCGGGGSGSTSSTPQAPTPLRGSVTISATGGSVTHTAVIVVIVS